MLGKIPEGGEAARMQSLMKSVATGVLAGREGVEVSTLWGPQVPDEGCDPFVVRCYFICHFDGKACASHFEVDYSEHGDDWLRSGGRERLMLEVRAREALKDLDEGMAGMEKADAQSA